MRLNTNRSTFCFWPDKLGLRSAADQFQKAGRICHLLGPILLTAFLAIMNASCVGLTSAKSVDPNPSSSSLQIATVSLPNGQVHFAYQATLAALGGKAPYTWTITSGPVLVPKVTGERPTSSDRSGASRYTSSVTTGQLPISLFLNASTGMISGTPTAAGTFDFTVHVTDSAGHSAGKPFTIAIAAGSPHHLSIMTSELPQGVTGQPYSVTLEGTGGSPAYSWGVPSGPLPSGLALDAATGRLSGTLMSSGSFSFTVQVHDSASPANAASRAYTMTVTTTPATDQYSGDPKHPCTDPRGATGFFYLYKDTNASRWFFCDPEGNRFFLIGIQVFDTADINTVVQNKYGGGLYDAYSQLVKRFRSLGFTAITEYANLHALPISTHGSSDGGNPVKMPFVYLWRPSWYALFSSPAVKDLLDDQSPVYTGYRGGQFADVWDANWARGVAWVFSNSNPDFTGGIAGLNASLWCIGVTVDDSDNLEGFKAGPMAPAPNSVPHDGWLVGVASPYRIFSQVWGVVFTDTTFHMKLQWQDYLQAKYATISALNASWGSNYSTFGTAATQVWSETAGTGDGHTTSFSYTLPHSPADIASIGVYVNGNLLGGDCPWVTIQHPKGRGGCNSVGTGQGIISGISGSNISGGKITYSTGAVTIAFSVPPSPGATISVSYRYGGWPKSFSHGSGLLDEDGSSPWWPADWRLANTSGPLASDLDAFLGRLAKQYFKTIHDIAKQNNPNHLIFAGDALNAYTRASILEQEAQYMDAAIMSSTETPSNDAQLIADYNSMGIPIIPWTTVLANADSPLSQTDCSADWGGLCVSKQAQRGQLYAQFGNGWWNLAGSDGYGFIVGWDYWQMIDNSSERMNFGLVTYKDNLYNGTEDQVAPCTDPWGSPCGGEVANYGNFLGAVKLTNRIWFLP